MSFLAQYIKFTQENNLEGVYIADAPAMLQQSYMILFKLANQEDPKGLYDFTHPKPLPEFNLDY